ncbi:netrin receptor UNC5C-like isoform X2 [Ptychodera flava]
MDEDLATDAAPGELPSLPLPTNAVLGEMTSSSPLSDFGSNLRSSHSPSGATPALDELLARAFTEIDRAKRRGTWRQSVFACSIFAAGMFDIEGGHLTLENMDIDLFIPPGALPEPTFIYLCISTDPRDRPRTTQNSISVSSVVYCGPPGLRFRERVILTYQHCADIEDKDVRVVPFSTDTPPGEVPRFKRVSEDDSSLTFVDGKKCFVSVNHFTGFTSVAETSKDSADSAGETGQNKVTGVAKKIINIVGFHGGLRPGLNKLPIRVHFHNDTSDAKQLVLEEEQRLKGHPADQPKKMVFLNNGQDLEFDIESIDEAWKLEGSGPKQTIDEEIVMAATDAGCSYRMAKQDPSSRTFQCDVKAFQRGNLKYNETSPLSLLFTVSELVEEQLVQNPSNLDTTYTLREKRRSKVKLQYKERLELSTLLDPYSPVGQDWRLLADNIGQDYDVIRQTEEQFREGKVTSPTRVILDHWDKMRAQSSLDDLKDLAAKLEGIGRLDAAEVVHNVVAKSASED